MRGQEVDQGFQHSNDSFTYAVCVRSITRERGIKDGADETRWNRWNGDRHIRCWNSGGVDRAGINQGYR